MNRRNLLNLGLLILIVALTLLAIYEPGREPPPAAKPKLTSLKKEDVSTIRIERHDAESIVLVKSDKGWVMTEPLKAEVNNYRIESILRLVETDSLGGYASAGRELGTFGLEQPRVHVHFNDDLTLAFGGNTPLDHRRYILMGDTIHLISDSYYYQLIGGFTTFIDSALLRPDARLVGLQLSNITLKLVEGRWQVDPEPENYSADQATTLIDAWHHASAIEVKKYDSAEGEDILLQLAGDDEPLRFVLTARTPELILARPDLGIQYHLADYAVTDLLTLQNQAPVTETE